MDKPAPTILDFNDTKVAFSHKTNGELKSSHFLFNMMNKPSLVSFGSTLGRWAIDWKLPVKTIIKKTIFKQFCAGENFTECEVTVQNLAKYGLNSMLDYGVEAKEDEAQFDSTAKEIKRAIDYASDHQYVPVTVMKISGLCKFSILEKTQSQEPLDEKNQILFNNSIARIQDVAQYAMDKNVALFVDAEESWIQDTIDAIADELMEKFNKNQVVIYNTFQMYRHDRLEFLKSSYKLAQEKGYKLGAKVVRGAYMEKERNRAEDLGYESPIQPDKATTDKDFDAALTFCMKDVENIACCCATHNETSSYHYASLIDKAGIDKKHAHANFAQLYGMSDHISFNLAKNGYNTAKYVPYGAIADVVPYLIRRAEENTSVSGQMSRELSLLKKEIERRKG